jgi:hypothetical protein
VTITSQLNADQTRYSGNGDVVPIFILGMHRSGTSCLAGSLQERGLHLGEVYEWRPFNRKGNRENQRIMDINNAVLEQSGGRWDQPPGHLQWDAAAAGERDAIVHELRDGSAGPWGFKDPRTLLTLPFWLEGVPEARFVGTFRHPAQVARSLRSRDEQMSIETGLELWRQYNERLLATFDNSPFPIVSFDLSDVDYGQVVDKLADRLGLTLHPQSSFFEPTLRTAAAETTHLSDPISSLYERLVQASAYWS